MEYVTWLERPLILRGIGSSMWECLFFCGSELIQASTAWAPYLIIFLVIIDFSLEDECVAAYLMKSDWENSVLNSGFFSTLRDRE